MNNYNLQAVSRKQVKMMLNGVMPTTYSTDELRAFSTKMSMPINIEFGKAYYIYVEDVCNKITLIQFVLRGYYAQREEYLLELPHVGLVWKWKFFGDYKKQVVYNTLEDALAMVNGISVVFGQPNIQIPIGCNFEPFYHNGYLCAKMKGYSFKPSCGYKYRDYDTLGIMIIDNIAYALAIDTYSDFGATKEDAHSNFLKKLEIQTWEITQTIETKVKSVTYKLTQV